MQLIYKKAIELIPENQKFILITDIRKLLYMSKAARDYAAKVDADRIYCSAVIVDMNSVIKPITNLYLKFSSPAYPTKVFSDIAPAIEWTIKTKNEIIAKKGK